MRENRTHGSEGGDGESRSRPLSVFLVSRRYGRNLPTCAGMTEKQIDTEFCDGVSMQHDVRYHFESHDHQAYSRRAEHEYRPLLL